MTEKTKTGQREKKVKQGRKEMNKEEERRREALNIKEMDWSV